MKNRNRPIIKLASALIMLCLVTMACQRPVIVSLKSLLLEMTDRDRLTRLPDPWYQLVQFSSYDRKSDTAGGEGWFANDDYTQFAGIDSSSGRKEYILADTEGPGAVVRWWMTFAGEGASSGTARVYIDGKEDPVLEGDPVKLTGGGLLAGEPLSSSVSPETETGRQGHNLYLPIPFSTHCRITYECDAIRINGDRRTPSIYYNICVRKYEKGTRVVSFSMDELKNSAVLIKSVNEMLLSPDSVASTRQSKDYLLDSSVASGDSAALEIRSTKSAIKRISLSVSAFDLEYALRSAVLKIEFDGVRTVWVPAGDFFGTGCKKTTSLTWNSSVGDDLKMISNWLMPFRENCRIWAVNYGNQPVKISLSAETTAYRWTDRSMYFGASWHEYHQVMTAGSELTGGTGKHRDINFIDISGKGIYAGDAVTVCNTVDAWWGEGDEKIFVDGEQFPSSIGTGTEDYYGYAWCRPELFNHPFIAQPSGSGNFHPGLTINMRYRALDAIPFRSSISSNIELWHWVPAVINYALTTYFYVTTPFVTNIPPVPEVAKLPVPINL